MEKEKKMKQFDEKNIDGMEYPIIGKSKAVEQLLKQIHSLAKSRRDVLMLGEAGVGKGAVAKDI